MLEQKVNEADILDLQEPGKTRTKSSIYCTASNKIFDDRTRASSV